MKSILGIFMTVTMLFLGSQVIAGHVSSHKNLTATLKTQDGQLIRCDVHKEDMEKVKHIKKGEKVIMACFSTNDCWVF